MNFRATLFVTASCFFIPRINAHSYLTEPISRTNQAQTQTGCRGPQCLGPCDAPRNRPGNTAPTAIERGAPLNLRWPRNNHAGGFIRVAWAPAEQSDQYEAFDAHVQLFTCHEMTCKAANFEADPLGGDSDGQAAGKCTTSLKVPRQLADGNWTLQWAWFGGAYQLGDYYSCVDFSVNGGEPAASLETLRVSYEGGDVHNSGSDKCLFFNTNRLHVCVNEPCTNGELPGKQNGYPDGISGGGAAAAEARDLQPKHNHDDHSTPTKTGSASMTASPRKQQGISQPDESLQKMFNITTSNIGGVNGDAKINVVYAETLGVGGNFSAIMNLANQGAVDAPGWSVTLNFTSTGKSLTSALGAEILAIENEDHVYFVYSMTPLLAGQSINVSLMGEAA